MTRDSIARGPRFCELWPPIMSQHCARSGGKRRKSTKKAKKAKESAVNVNQIILCKTIAIITTRYILQVYIKW